MRSRPGHTARSLHPRNIISTSAPMTTAQTTTDMITSRMVMPSPSWPFFPTGIFLQPQRPRSPAPSEAREGPARRARPVRWSA